MQYSDSLTKGFFTGNGSFMMPTSDQNVSRWSDFSDPTYMGFNFLIWPYTVYDPNNQDLDYLPQGLFLGVDGGEEEHVDSAVSYLQRRGEYYRANMMKEFREGMMYLSNEEPWVFETVEGLSALWQIDSTKPFRAKDKKLTFTCKESISMRITYLIDLYRKAAWDAQYMRWMLPETQRKFTIYFVITDYRTLQRGGIPYETATFISYKLEHCEFDFLPNALDFSSSLSTYGTAEAVSKIQINVGKITELNSFGLLGGVLKDTLGTYDRGKESGAKNFANFTTITDGTGDAIASSTDWIKGVKNTTHVNVDSEKQKSIEAISLQNESNSSARALSEETEENKKRVLQGVLQRLKNGAVARLENFVNTFANGLLLGNVYGFSPLNLLGSLQSLQANPTEFIAGALNRSAAAGDASALATRVEFTGDEKKLLSEFIGIVSDIQNEVAGSSLESSSIGEIIQSVNASDKLITTTVSQAVERTGIGTLDGILSKVIFDAPNKLEGSLGSVTFDELPKNNIESSDPKLPNPSSKLPGKGGNVNLE